MVPGGRFQPWKSLGGTFPCGGRFGILCRVQRIKSPETVFKGEIMACKNCVETLCFFLLLKNKNNNFTWKKKSKNLGIYFRKDKCASCFDWAERIQIIKRLIFTWEKRNLSIIGKICIIKTFSISQLVYIMQAFVLPDHVLVEINRLLLRFLSWRERERERGH